MKRVVIGKITLMLFLFTFAVSGIFAAAPTAGTCTISLRSECVGAGNHILMGVSSLTNAHGEFPDVGTYNYVLCCALGEGSTTCTESNKIIGLSSATNAHAQEPLLSSYLTSVCYEDLVCEGTLDSTCPTNLPLGVLSLSADTNAHIGAFADYPVKVCCGSGVYTLCSLIDAQWNIESAIAGQRVYLQVTGTPSCSGLKMSFKIWEDDTSDDTPATVTPLNVSFNGATATGTWLAEWMDDGVFGGDPEYYFNATLERNPPLRIASSNELAVSQYDEDICAQISTCEDYTDEEYCESDASLCDVAKDNSIPGLVECGTEGTVCKCTWDTDTSSCGFTWTEVTECGNPIEGEGCTYGCTLCHNTETGDYCKLGSTCPPNEFPLGNNNGSCEFGEGCLSPLDCGDGDTDSCAEGLFCSNGMCYSFEDDFVNSPISLGLCKITQAVEKTCDEEPVGSKIIAWTGTWMGEGECDSTCQACEAGGKSTVSCAAQVQLPFFDYIEMIIAVLIIALIYISMIFRKKFLKRKKK